MEVWNNYSIACYHGTSAQELVINVMARSYRDALRIVRKWGYTPNTYDLVR